MGNSGVSVTAVSEAKALGLAIGSLSWKTCTAANALTAQVLVAQLDFAVATVTINKLGIWIKGAGVTTGAGINGLAIYSKAGLLLAQTGDMTAAFAVANSYQEGTLGAGVQVVAGTEYYLCALANYTGTAPTIPGTVTTANVPAIRGNNPAVTLSAQTAFPANFNPATAAPNNGAFFLTAGT
jgi:hypothetical protein